MIIKAELHRRLLDNYADNASVIPLIKMWPTVETAIEKVINDGDYDSYVESIREYDEHIWTESKKEDGSNPIAYKKWKIYPSWSELNWAVVYERVRRQLNFETVLIRTDKVLEGATTAGDVFYKDVDGGLAIKGELNNKEVLFPVVVMEHKGGHFCKTACTGVNAIGRRFHDTNPNVITVQITENNVTVGKDQTDGLINEIDIFIIDRGRNQYKKDSYWMRNSAEMKIHEEQLVHLLSNAEPKHFLNIKVENVSNKSFRDQLNETNYISKEKVFV
jgi:hypothetical protein